MDHAWLGTRRSGAHLVILENSASRSASGGRDTALCRLRPVGAQSSRSGISQAQRGEDLELVFICLRHSERVLLNGGAVIPSAAAERSRADCSSLALLVRRDSRLPSLEC